MFKNVINFFKKLWKPTSNERTLQSPIASDIHGSRHYGSTRRVQSVVEPVGIQNNGKKKFVVKKRSGKKFVVKGTVDISPQNSSSQSGKLKNISKTRPKKCPYCRTEDKITKTPENKWKCKACEYEWQ
ncbi:hypothetical protein THIOM_004952 [Candidatus Thiomargarita nelsonii]|uniref:Transposase n=1 Tax=Candidatus Thiomargarita nelsonii TaxID=1003181 RepID=A0A0A6RKQ3_9GAMM|nr:hypothetical protein THIOM_004952 [Candidatus Thiomargarita nelsonii]